MLKRIGYIILVVLLLTPGNTIAGFLDIFSNESLTNGSRFAFVPGTDAQKVIVIDTVKREVAAELKIPHVPGSVVVSEKLDLLFATDPENQTVTIIYLGSGEVVKQLDIGMRPDSALINPFDRYVAFGSHDGSVSVWDMQTLRMMLRVDGLDSAENMTFGIDGRNLYVVEERKKRISIIEMHRRDKVAEILLGGDEDPNTEISAISRSADGYTGFVSVTSENRVVVIDLINWKIKRSIPAGKAPVRPYSTADNRYVLIPNRDDKSLTVLSALSHEVVATIPTHVKARELNSGWLDTVAFIMPAEGNQISVIDLDTLRHTGMIELPGSTDDGLVTSDSKMLFASLIDSGGVVAVDARARTLAKVIHTPVKKLKGIEIGVSNNICH